MPHVRTLPRDSFRASTSAFLILCSQEIRVLSRYAKHLTGAIPFSVSFLSLCLLGVLSSCGKQMRPVPEKFLGFLPGATTGQLAFDHGGAADLELVGAPLQEQHPEDV